MSVPFISVFRFVQLTAAVKLVSLQPYDRKYFSLKTAKARVLSTINGKQKVLSVASRTPKFGPSGRQETIYMTPV